MVHGEESTGYLPTPVKKKLCLPHHEERTSDAALGPAQTTVVDIKRHGKEGPYSEYTVWERPYGCECVRSAAWKIKELWYKAGS